MAVKIDRTRQKEAANVDLITPHGAEITVTQSRANALLARQPLTFADGVWRKYAYAGEDNVVAVGTKTGAQAPRTGSKASTGGE